MYKLYNAPPFSHIIDTPKDKLDHWPNREARLASWGEIDPARWFCTWWTIPLTLIFSCSAAIPAAADAVPLLRVILTTVMMEIIPWRAGSVLHYSMDTQYLWVNYVLLKGRKSALGDKVILYNNNIQRVRIIPQRSHTEFWHGLALVINITKCKEQRQL